MRNLRLSTRSASQENDPQESPHALPDDDHPPDVHTIEKASLAYAANLLDHLPELDRGDELQLSPHFAEKRSVCQTIEDLVRRFPENETLSQYLGEALHILFNDLYLHELFIPLEKLSALAHSFPQNLRLAEIYAHWLCIFIVEVFDFVEQSQHIHQLKAMMEMHPSSTTLTDYYAAALGSLAAASSELKLKMSLIEELQQISEDTIQRDGVISSYASALRELVWHQEIKGAIETLRVLKSLLHDHPYNKDILYNYADALDEVLFSYRHSIIDNPAILEHMNHLYNAYHSEQSVARLHAEWTAEYLLK